jgi:hypothetical protein
MQFIRTNINKTYRNGELNVSNVAVTNVGGGGGSSFSGNFLPAVNNGDGSYTVDLSKVVFTGNLIGEGEITAYGQGSTGGGSTSTGSVTIYDGLDSVAVDAALSANQGRILREMILEAGTGGSTLLSKLEDVTLANLADGQILKYDATSKKWVNGDGTKVTWTNIERKPAALTDANIAKWNENSHTHTNKIVLDKITEANLTSWNNKLDKAIWDKAFYFDSAGDLRAKVNVIGEKEISAYGAGTTSGVGTVTIVDALTSTATDCALSANMGRILKDMIDFKGAVSSWEDITDKPSWITSTKPSYSWNEIAGKPSTFTPSEHTHNYASSVKVGNTAYNAASNVISLPAYPTLSSLGAVSSTDFNAHTGNTTLHITSTERTNWNDANNKKHTHSNKSVLDGITSAKVTNWDGVVTNWNKAFYFDSNGDLKVKVNVIGEKEVSAYGAGTSGGSGSITIVDALTSTATDAALSANQGRILKELIDNVGGGVSSWNDLTDKPSWIGANKPSYTWAEISGKPSTFAPSSHTHNYASTVKVGSTSYNISGNTISLPAYPTVPSALKNPNALTISLNGTSQGAYDGSAAKSFNITAASVGAAASSHSHTIAQVTNLQSTLDGKANTSHIQAWTADECTTYTSDDNTKGCTPAAIKKAFTMFTATAANKVTNTLTFTGYQSKSFNGSAAVSVAIPNNTNQLTNGAGFITSSGNAGSATKLQTARTIWGQSFNGTGNVSGSMTGVGAISMSGNLTMAHSSIPTLTLKNNNSADVQIILDRNANASWKILNQSGTLYFQNDWVNGSKGSYFTALSIAYQTGHIVSKGNITSNGEITAYSDIRLKTDIQPLKNRGYIKPVTYKKDGKDSIGFIAQEVRELYPELVIEDNTEDKYLSVNYAQYVAVLQAQIIDLKKEIDELKNIKTK